MNAEAKLLEEYGHQVIKYERTNAEIYEDGSFSEKIRAFREVCWSERSYQEVSRVIKSFQPTIMHVHGYWFILTPSILKAARDQNVKTIRTLHNYGLISPCGQFLRDGLPCELCLKGNPYRILWHRCYPGRSLLKSVVSLRSYLGVRKRGYLSPWINGYIALSEFGRKKFVEVGIPKEKLFVKPNFIPDPQTRTRPIEQQHTAVFIGRLSPEKGVDTLLEAWEDIRRPLTVVGDGPSAGILKRKATRQVLFAGEKSHEAALDIVAKASIFVFPSKCYEGFPMSLLEAMALGKPVIASDLGPRPEIIRDGLNGLLFKAGDASDLRQKIKRLLYDDVLRRNLGNEARASYLRFYTPEVNYTALLRIYETVLGPAA